MARGQIETGKSGRSASASISGSEMRRSNASYDMYSLVRSGSGQAITLPTISSRRPRVSCLCESADEIGRMQRQTPERQLISVIYNKVSNKHQSLLEKLYVIVLGREYHYLGCLFPDWDTIFVPFDHFEGVAADV